MTVLGARRAIAMGLALVMGTPCFAQETPAVTTANWYWGPANHWSWHHTRRLFPSENVSRGSGPIAVLPAAPRDISTIAFDDPVSGKRLTVSSMLDATYTDGFIVLKDGRVVSETYFNGMTASDPHLVMSVTKSFVGVLAGILAERGQIDLDARVTDRLPELQRTAFEGATVRNAIDMTIAATRDPEGYKHIDQAMGWVAPDEATAPGLLAFLATLQGREGQHGQRFLYFDPSPQATAWLMERATNQDFASLLQEEIWGRLGAEHDAYVLLDGHQEAFAPAGLNVTLRDLARFGQMMAQGGRYNGRQIVPRAWIQDILTGGDLNAWQAGDGGDHIRFQGYDHGSYRSHWWVADRGCGRFAAIGLGGQTVIVDPVAHMVVVKLSSPPDAQIGEDIIRSEFSAADAIIRSLSGHGC